MRRSIKILPAYLVLSAIPYMLGAVVLSDADMTAVNVAEPGQVAVEQPADKMPDSHGPVLDLPTGPMLVNPNPSILDQPIKESDEKNKKTPAKKPVVDKPTADKPAEKKITPKKKATTESADTKKSTAKKTAENKSANKSAKTEPTAPLPPAEPPKPLSPEMQALRDHVRKTLNYYSSQPLNTRDNTAAHILQACLAFGCDTTVRQGGAAGEPINGFTCLCWNYPCGGYNLLKLSGNHIAAQIGYGLQSNPSEFLAILALARVPKDYPIRADQTVRTVADLVESEKLSCRAGSDVSFKLIGLSRYLPPNATWKNDLGQTWSVARLIKQELDNVGQPAPNGGTHRLLALSYAVDRRGKQDQPIDGQFRRAKKYIDQYRDYALAMQNPDGSWHPQFFKYQGQGGSNIGQVNSTGHILAWLAVSLPDEKLDDERVVRCVAFLSNLLRGRRYNSLTKTSSRDIAARMNALYALSVYDTRMFKQHDKAEETDEAEVPAGEEKVSGRASSRR